MPKMPHLLKKQKKRKNSKMLWTRPQPAVGMDRLTGFSKIFIFFFGKNIKAETCDTCRHYNFLKLKL
jgi:hypothetical protein